MNIIAFLIVGLVGGFLGAVFHEAHGIRIFENLLLGAIGGLAGGLLFRTFPADSYGFWGSIAGAAFSAGAIVFLAGLLPWHLHSKTALKN